MASSKLGMLIVPLLAACTRPSSAVELAPAVASDAPSETVFGSLVTRHGTITIKLGEAGPLYDVLGKDGEVLARDADDAYLQEHLPVFHQFVQGTLAADGLLGGLLGGLGYQ